MRWLQDEEKDLWQMKIKRWRQKAVDRKELASIIMKTKAIGGPYIQGVRREMTSNMITLKTHTLQQQILLSYLI